MKSALMATLVSKLTNNWTIKLGALLIALALWSYTNQQVRIERTLTVHINRDSIQKVPDGYRVTSIYPETFTVRVSVPISHASTLRPTITPRLTIDAEASQKGEQRFPVTVDTLGLSEDIRIEWLNLETEREIRVALQLVTEEYLPVQLPKIEGVPASIQSTIVLEPTRVRIRSTRAQFQDMIDRNQRITFAPITLTDIDPQMQQAKIEKVVLVPQQTDLDMVDQVTATITLTPGMRAKRTISVPVHLLTPPDFHTRYRVELGSPQVAITIQGPEALLYDLQPDEDVTAYVMLRSTGEAKMVRDVEIAVRGPTWMTYEPMTIRVTTQVIATPSNK
jgi:hypothetical protein